MPILNEGPVMFEKALILRAGDVTVDLGLIAETVFLYGTTHLLLNRAAVVALAKSISSDDLISFFARDEIKLSYVRQSFGVSTSGLPKTYDLGGFELYSTGAGEKRLNYRDEIALGLERAFGKSIETRKLAKAIADRAKLHRFKNETPDNSIPGMARTDVRDQSFLKKAVVATLTHLVPTYRLPQFHFRVLDTGKGFAVDTNLDFNAINEVYHQTVPPSHSTIDPAYLLAHILDARADLFFAAYYMAEPVTAPIYGDIIQIKHFDFLRRRYANVEEVEQFTEMVVPDFPTIREVMNSGERTFADFLKLLDKADRFKKWIQKTNPDAGLLQEYHKAVTAQTWADKLGPKSARFAVATGIGVIAEAIAPTGLGVPIGVGAGATDTFLLDRILRGWRPNQFIAGPYRKFVMPDE